MIFVFVFLFCSICEPVRAASENQNPSPPSPEALPSDGTTDADGGYIEGTVIVTIASPKKTSLAKKGPASFDSRISIDKSYNFGNARILAKTNSQRSFLSDKTLYVSEVSSASYSTQDLMDKLERKAYVLRVEPDYKHRLNTVSDDPLVSEQWHLDGTGDFFCSSQGIAYSSAQNMAKTGEPVIAVMDTGIDYTHEDLRDHMWVNPAPDTLPGTYGYDFTIHYPDCMDTDGHGTHCAGTIAAVSGNQKGIAGISDAKLMALKVFGDDGETSNSTILDAMNYILQAKKAGVNITAVNCSWGGGRSGYAMPSLVNQLGKMGVLFVFASGNDGINHDSNLGLSCPYDLYSGSYAENRNYIIITGSSDENDNPSVFSDYGSKDVDLFAPGENILSAYCEDNYLPGTYGETAEKALTASFFPFDLNPQTGAGGETPEIYTDHDLEIRTKVSASAVSSTERDYHADPGSGSLKWTVNLGSPQQTSKSAYLYLDVTDYDLDPEAVYYVSMMFGGTDSEGDFSWDHFVKKSSGKLGDETNRFYIARNGRIYFMLVGLETRGELTGSSVYYLDNIGLSRANPDTSLFGKYEVMNGTSMAAPMATGAVALLSEIYPGDSAKNRRGRLLACTRQTPGAQGKCLTGGVLHLANMALYAPVPDDAEGSSENKLPSSSNATVKKKTIKVAKIKLRASKKTLKAGKRLKLKAVVSPKNASSKKIKWSSSRKKWASVSKGGVVKAKKKGAGHTVKITAAATDGSRKKASVKIKIKKA